MHIGLIPLSIFQQEAPGQYRNRSITHIATITGPIQDLVEAFNEFTSDWDQVSNEFGLEDSEFP